MSDRQRAILDRLLQKWTSRKLMVFLVSVVALFLGKIDSGDWVDIAVMYIGAEAAIDAVVRLRGRS